jgi:hypothetical protein
METIGRYVTSTTHGAQEPGRGCTYFFQRAARHLREAERLYRLGDARQAAMHASISHKHAAMARELEAIQTASSGAML